MFMKACQLLEITDIGGVSMFYNEDFFMKRCDAFITHIVFLDRSKSYLHSLSVEELNARIEELEHYLGYFEYYGKDGQRVKETLDVLRNELTQREIEKSREDMLRAGKKAERNVRYGLRQLPATDYIMLPLEDNENLILENEVTGVRHEYDNILISNRGVIIVECKGFKGELIYTSKKVWFRKINGRATPLDKSPIIQVDYQKRLIDSIMKELDYDVPVYGVICVCNPTAILTICKETKFPIVSLEELLETVELTGGNKEILTTEQMEEILEVIDGHRVYDVNSNRYLERG